MAKVLVSDELWGVVEPLLPAPRPKKTAGRPRVPDRACLTGIVFVLKTGIPWEYLPQEAGVWYALHRALSDRQGIPLASLQTADHVNEGTVLLDAVDAIPPIKRPRGRPRRRPDKLHADKAYDARKRRAALRRRGITPRIARKGIDSKTRLGRHRWVVERDFAWLHRNRRLLIRFERRDDLQAAFLHLGCALICWSVCSDLFC